VEVEVKPGFPRHALPRVWQWIEPHRAKLLDDNGPENLRQFMAAWDQEWLLQMSLQVLCDGELAGFVHLTGKRASVLTCYFPRESYRTKLVEEALRQAIREFAFGTLGALKVEWRGFRSQSTLVGVLRKLGGKKEAEILRAGLQGGQWVPMVQMGVLREEVI
jgi:RimJ/RimL family protein N-acetyltransferase